MCSVSRPNSALPLLLLLLLPLLQPSSARIFERCELAALLQEQYGLPASQVATLVCIAQHASDLNTAHFGGGTGPGGGSHGIFQISDVYWCSPPGQGAGCGLSCSRLRDDDIADDVLCVRKIYAEHQRLSGDGFNAWQAYSTYCRQDAASYVAGCAHGQSHALHAAASYHQPKHQLQQLSYHQQALAPVQHQVSYHHQQAVVPQRPQGKIYSRCELAQELFYQHKLPMQQIPTWVCIAQHESSYNTAAVGRLNADGSADHGLFQISDLFWCTHDQRGGKGCHASCNQFLDSSIADDVQCIRRIHQEHTQISGDGFTAWTVYNRDCRNQRYEQVAACFAKPQVLAPSHPNAIGGGVAKVSYASPFGQPATTPNPYYRPAQKQVSYQAVQATSSFQGNPFLRAQPRPPPPPPPTPYVQAHPNLIGSPVKSHFANVYSTPATNPLLSYQHYTTPKQQAQQEHYSYQHHPQQHQQPQHYYTTTPKRAGKVYKRCELAQELYFSHKFPMQDLATWVCIAEHESRLDTAAVGRLNADGSADHGLFQISDLYWCTHGGGVGVGGKGCHIDCDRLLDSDITDDVQCIRTIHEEHTRISGDGFTAWTVYNGHCRDRSSAEIASCFDPDELKKEPVKPVKPAKPILSNELARQPKPKGKVFSRCELAQELYYKHKLPMKEIPTWVCIAQHESSYNTAAVGRLNADGSEDHGLFQISDLFWCTHGEGGGKGCHIECDRLLDSDISDDVQCIRTIYEEHTRISGDGFTAWTVYNGHCRHQNLAQLSDCFSGNEISEAQKPTQHEKRPQAPAPQPSLVKVSANHDYVANPFLQRLSASHKTPTTAKPTKGTVKPPTHLAVVANHPFGANPFLQQLKPQQQNAISKPLAKPSAFKESPSRSKPGYDHNPFLKPANRISANTIKPAVPSKPAHSQQAPAYSSNPFLSQAAKPTTGRPKTTTTHRPAVPAKEHSYISSDSFRKEIIKFTATSSSATTTRAPTTQRSTTHPTTTTARPFTTRTPYTWITVATPHLITPTSPYHATKAPTTTRATTRQTTTRPTTRTTPATRATTTTRATPRPTTRSTTRATTRSTTTRPTVRSTHPTTTRSTTRSTTTRPATRTTTRSTTSYTTRFTTPHTTRTTTRSTTARPTTRSTTRSTTARPTTRSTTARPTTRSTTRSTTRYTTVQPTTSRSTSRTTRSTTTWRPFTSSWFSTTRYPTPKPTFNTIHRTTTRPTTTKWPQHFSAPSTTPRPYLFTSSKATTTTTRRPSTTARSGTTSDPFDHPFFAKFKATFEKNRPTTATKTTPIPSSKAISSTFTASPYYAKFQENSAKLVAKTAYVYDFGQNRTTTTTRPKQNRS